MILNGSNREQTLPPEKYWEVLGDAVTGKDVITNKIVNLQENIIIPSKGVYVIEY